MNLSLQSNAGRPASTALLVVVLCAMICGLTIQHQGARAPGPAVSNAVRPPKSKSCIDCHELASDFGSVPHAQTLHSSESAEVRSRFAGKSFEIEDGSAAFRFFENEKTLWYESDAYPSPIPVQWLLGSGHHAVTPVSTWENESGKTELLELAVSWYPDRGLGLTA